MKEILDYLISSYDPETIILYGSYADGSYNTGSDFDAMLIAACKKEIHDVSFIKGTQLDVFVYPKDMEFKVENFTRLYHGRMVMDVHGKGKILMGRVKKYIEHFKIKSREEIGMDLDWCQKMLDRTSRGDAEGYYRWHWLLCDSLEFYCSIRKQFYFGPKKTIRMMQQKDLEAFQIYENALSCMDRKKLERWVNYLKSQM